LKKKDYADDEYKFHLGANDNSKHFHLSEIFRCPMEVRLYFLYCRSIVTKVLSQVRLPKYQ